MIQHNHDLEILKQMAMADGILTENEKELFRSYFQLTDKEAEEMYEEALEIYRELAKENRSAHIGNVAMTCNNFGVLYLSLIHI